MRTDGGGFIGFFCLGFCPVSAFLCVSIHVPTAWRRAFDPLGFRLRGYAFLYICVRLGSWTGTWTVSGCLCVAGETLESADLVPFGFVSRTMLIGIGDQAGGNMQRQAALLGGRDGEMWPSLRPSMICRLQRKGKFFPSLILLPLPERFACTGIAVLALPVLKRLMLQQKTEVVNVDGLVLLSFCMEWRVRLQLYDLSRHFFAGRKISHYQFSNWNLMFYLYLLIREYKKKLTKIVSLPENNEWLSLCREFEIWIFRSEDVMAKTLDDWCLFCNALCLLCSYKGFFQI